MLFSVSEFLVGNTKLIFSDKNVFRLIFYPISLAATEGTCSGLSYFSWSIPGFILGQF